MSCIQRMKDKSEAAKSQYLLSTDNQAELLRELGRLQIGLEQSQSNKTGAEDDIFATNNIPYPKNPQFFGRARELEAIRKSLDHDPEDLQFRSMTLWGMGGIGKTQLALAYAHEQESKGVTSIFWINSETPIDIYQSYTKIADILELDGRVPDASGAQNQFLITKWLQKSRTSKIVVRVDFG